MRLARTGRDRKFADSPLEGGVMCELVSVKKFPAYREINREFFTDSRLVALVNAKDIATSGAYGPIPYASEQGIFCGPTGN
jgi:hypothetical protein